MRQTEHPDLLVGSQTSDDAAVFRIAEDRAIVHTADFFTPIVDDPRDFGRIAAANAFSDVYAMGGKPLMALNLVAFPLDDLGGEILREILVGGAEVADTAGAPIGGGHSIDDPEPKYGLAVTGIVDPTAMLTNSGAKPGNALVLTKPLGAGLATTAAKRGLAEPGLILRATEVMCRLNADASEQARSAGATAATDVTGFGLLGHLHEMCTASGTGACIEAEAIPAIDGVIELAESGEALAGGSRRNRDQAEGFVRWNESVTEARRVLATDAMTSGGLLVSVPPERTTEIDGVVIGEVRSESPGRIEVK